MLVLVLTGPNVSKRGDRMLLSPATKKHIDEPQVLVPHSLSRVLDKHLLRDSKAVLYVLGSRLTSSRCLSVVVVSARSMYSGTL